MEWKANYSIIKYILFTLVLIAFLPKQGQGQVDSIIKEYRAETLNKGPFTEEDLMLLSAKFRDKGFNEATPIKKQQGANNRQNTDTLFYLFFLGYWSMITWQQWILIFLVFLAGIMVIFLLRKMAKVYSYNKHLGGIGAHTNYDIVGDNVADFNAQEALYASLKEEDYRLSIRVNFVEILQKLAALGYIKWRKDKSTALYTMELEKNAPHYVNDFKEVAYIFDYIWYSDKAISKAQYQIATPYFSNFLAAIV